MSGTQPAAAVLQLPAGVTRAHVAMVAYPQEEGEAEGAALSAVMPQHMAESLRSHPGCAASRELQKQAARLQRRGRTCYLVRPGGHGCHAGRDA